MNTNAFNPNEAFFVIDSNNLEAVSSKMYGWCLVDGGLVEIAEDMAENTPTGEGAYVYIKRENDHITIMQDFVGSYGLCMYQDEHYFAISNSFIMLEDYIKKEHKLTLNKAYADQLMVFGLCSTAISHTLVNEIAVLDRAAIVHIDVSAKSLSLEYHDYHENTVAIDSEQGIAILDKWYYKWRHIVETVKSKTTNITYDLSGGYDSRMSFAVSGLNGDGMTIYSHEDGLYTHNEDYEIATEMANTFGFHLNDRTGLTEPSEFFTKEDILGISFYTKLGFNKQMSFKYGRLNNYRYCFTGAGGEIVRKYWDADEESFIRDQVRNAEAYTTQDVDITDTAMQELTAACNEVREKFHRFGREADSSYMGVHLMREGWLRNHFGRGAVENYLAGIIQMAPLYDPDLHMLKLDSEKCMDKDLMMTVIFDRYDSRLLDFRFEGGRAIEAGTIRYAKEIDRKYPFACKACEKAVSPVEKTQRNTNMGVKCRVSNEDISETVKELFLSKRIKNAVCTLYDEKIYMDIVSKMELTKFFPMERAVVSIAIGMVYEDTLAYECMNCRDISEFVNGCLSSGKSRNGDNQAWTRYPYLANYMTARIDIKNKYAEANDIEFIKISDSMASVRSPQWFAEDGKGYVVESTCGKLQLVLRCVKSGNLQLALRGKDVRNKNGERIPFWIDYRSLKINDSDMLENDIQCACHDHAYKTSFPVEDGDVVTIDLEWLPHDECQSKAPVNVCDQGKNIRLQQELQTMKNEQAQLQKRIDDIENSTSYKVGLGITKLPREIKNHMIK